MKKNFIAVFVGLGLSVIILLCAEGVFILNKRFAFFSQPQVVERALGEDPELTEFIKTKYQQSHWARQDMENFFSVQQQAPRSTKLDYSLKHGGPHERRNLWLTSSIFRPNLKFRSLVKVENSDRVIYDVTIDTNERSRRVVVFNGTSQDQGVLFFGDSNTFGEGVNSDETYASQFAKLNPQYQVFNFGVGGSAPNVFLEEIENFPQYRYTDLKVPAKNIGVYLIIDDTIERMICRLNCLREYRRWMLKHPYYKLNSQGELEYQGSFAQSRKGVNSVYSFFASSALLDFYRVDYPLAIRQSDMDFMAKVIKVYTDKLKKHMNLERFVVFSYPGSRLDPEMYKAAFAKVGIEFWDFSQVDFGRITDGRSAYPWDYHPTPVGHYLLAELLTYKLKQTNPKGGIR
ncbi:MAG: SGNH/GDSL hydrolase family protein [Bdellovibrio sp.]|nr:SGNH/GDSL hydrolase family protein [Bdellovibrio sp.]